jgi:glycosyltransferase 2 family protein
VTELDAGDLVPLRPGPPSRTKRWHALVGVIGLAGLTVAVLTVAHDVQDRRLPSIGAMAAALVLHVIALIFASRGWASLFPADADRRALARSLYTSQLAKYLPAGGVLQAAGQVTLSGLSGGVRSAAIRLPVFSLCLVTAGATLASGLAFASDLPTWGRVLAGAGLLAPCLLDRRVLAAVLRHARRVVSRLPEPDALPPKPAIVAAYLWGIGNMVAYGAAFAVLLTDITNVNPFIAGAALCAAWVAGYLVVPVPSGLGVREAVLVAALPASAASLVTASVAHRLLGIIAEAMLAGLTTVRARLVARGAAD